MWSTLHTKAVLHGAIGRDARGGLALEDGAGALADGICHAAPGVGDRLKEAGELQGGCGSVIFDGCESLRTLARCCKGGKNKTHAACGETGQRGSLSGDFSGSEDQKPEEDSAEVDPEVGSQSRTAGHGRCHYPQEDCR